MTLLGIAAIVVSLTHFGMLGQVWGCLLGLTIMCLTREGG